VPIMTGTRFAADPRPPWRATTSASADSSRGPKARTPWSHRFTSFVPAILLPVLVQVRGRRPGLEREARLGDGARLDVDLLRHRIVGRRPGDQLVGPRRHAG